MIEQAQGAACARLAAAHPGPARRGAARARRRPRRCSWTRALPATRPGPALILGWIDLVEGDASSAERAFREAVRIYAANEDHGRLCEAQRALAEVLLDAGKVDEAERHALAAHALVSAHDLTSRSSTMTTLGKVRAAQGRDADAEQLLRESLAMLAGTDYRLLEVAARVALARFLRAPDATVEAAELEAGLPSRLPGWLGSEDALSVAAV